MKKFFAILLAMLLVLSMGAFALAEETEASTTTVVTLGKVVVISGDAAVMPAETFGFSIANDSVSDAAEGVTADTMPTPKLGTAQFNAGATDGTEVEILINFPTYKSVGIYTYKITEIAGNTAGMTYSAATLTLKVTVQNDGKGGFEIAGTSLEGSDNKKHDTFENKYEAGKLTVSKTVTGALGDKTKLFDFSVTFTAPEGKTAKSTISYVDGTDEKTLTFGEDGTANATFKLKDAASITFTNIPAGVTYTVTEVGAVVKDDELMNGDYKVTMTGENGTIAGDATSTAAFTNTKGGTIDTGITTDTLPYAVLLGLVVLAGVALLLKRRMGTND